MKKEPKNLIESILFVAEKPVSVKELASVSGCMVTDIQNALKELTKEYEKRGIKLVRKGEYFSFVSDPANAKEVSAYLNEELRHDLSQQALETLAIITYKQPLTRMDIEDLRGVNSEALIRSLLIRGLICEVGRKDTIGRPILYGTTMEFIQYFGLLSEEDIPKLEEQSLFKNEDENSTLPS
jgi:segregation and condensation protein B